MCVKCQSGYDAETAGVCPRCGLEGPLDVQYDYEDVARTMDRASLERREPWMWRYRELLPLDELSELPALHVGWTPIHGAPRLAAHAGVAGLWIKDEGRNPSRSIEDRGAAVSMVKALERSAKTVACASTGDAAVALATFAAMAERTCVAFIPSDVPASVLARLRAFGAQAVTVAAGYDKAFELCAAVCRDHGWYNASCTATPHGLDGAKTVGLEIGEQLGERMPDWVVVPAVNGGVLSAVHKGMKDMFRLTLAEKVPKLLGVVASGTPALEAAFRTGELEPVTPKTGIQPMRVGTPRNWRRALEAVRESGGAFVTVSDDEISGAIEPAASLGGVLAAPIAGSAVAGLVRAVKKGNVAKNESVAVLITGAAFGDASSFVPVGEDPIVAEDVSALSKELATRKLV